RLNCFNNCTNIPVILRFFPLNKEEIIRQSQAIGTYDISIQPYEDCCTVFVPASPVTNPKRSKVVAIESGVDFSAEIEEAIAGIEVVNIKPLSKEEQPFSDLL